MSYTAPATGLCLAAASATCGVAGLSSSSGSLAATGVDSAGLVLGGLGLLVAGFALIRTAAFRRRVLPKRG